MPNLLLPHIKKMKKIILSVLASLVFFTACEKSEKKILNETISTLDEIETIKYKSNIEIIDKGIIIITDTDNMFFDFTNVNKTKGLKYHFKNKYGELIFNGKETIQSDNEKRIILTNKNPDALNPLIATLYPLKEILPKLINDKNVDIIRKSDSIIFNQKHYVINFIIKKGHIDWMDLNVKNEINYDSKYSLFIDKSNFIPTKIIAQNGESGIISRTVENIDFDFKPKKDLWIGSNLPIDYARYDQGEYFAGFKNKLASYVGKKIKDWELPSLKDSKPVNPSKLKGNVILLEFWFENCGWCVKAIPELNEINRKYSDKLFKMYGVGFIKENDRDNLINYVNEEKMNYPSLYNGKSVATEYGIRSAPTFLIIDKSGTIIYAQSSFNKEEIINLIEKNI